VVLDPVTAATDFDDATLTENTRSSYPLDFIPNASATGRGGHPKNIVMLTCDAFGVLPPISRLSPERRCTISFRAIPRASPAPSAA
jgi:phosphoenolpyruvate carboxykinase (ATP)